MRPTTTGAGARLKIQTQIAELQQMERATRREIMMRHHPSYTGGRPSHHLGTNLRLIRREIRRLQRFL